MPSAKMVQSNAHRSSVTVGCENSPMAWRAHVNAERWGLIEPGIPATMVAYEIYSDLITIT